jgi:hypothetical protein
MRYSLANSKSERVEPAGSFDEHRMVAATPHDPPLFRFGLRQLLWFFVLASMLFAAMALAPGGTAFLLVLMTTIFALHVLATAIGHRLRDRSDQQNAFESADGLTGEAVASLSERSQRLAVVRTAPRSPWHSRGATTLPWLTQIVMIAFISGGIVGATYLVLTIGYRTSPAGVIVGGISVAVVCGWIAFLTASFYGVFRHGFREALSEQQKDA